MPDRTEDIELKYWESLRRGEWLYNRYFKSLYTMRKNSSLNAVFFDPKGTGNMKGAFAAVGRTFIDERMLFRIPESEINKTLLFRRPIRNPVTNG